MILERGSFAANETAMPPFDDRYRPSKVIETLDTGYYDKVEPAVFPSKTLRFRNQKVAKRVGLGALTDQEWVSHFGDFRPLPDNLQAPLALRYHGHQFRAYNPNLGDGRGFLFAQLVDPGDNRLLDLGTKGSGQTPWSRSGDGRLTLKGGLREILATEMLDALGVYTSQSFSLIETGESLWRGDEPSPTRSSVLVRLSHSHIRFGTFERLAYLGDKERIRKLVNYCVKWYGPSECAVQDDQSCTTQWYSTIVDKMAKLAAQWMAAGFVHGVLNTDNMNITGESFDYGPWRFLPIFDPNFTAAYFDESGLYAYSRQSEAVRWNLDRLADALGLICPIEKLRFVANEFEPRFLQYLHKAFLRRLGVTDRDAISNSILVSRIMCFLNESKLPFDQFFFDWYGGNHSEERAKTSDFASFYSGAQFSAMREAMHGYVPSDMNAMQLPYFAKKAPCTMVIDEVERIWERIDKHDDWAAFDEKLRDIEQLASVYRNTTH